MNITKRIAIAALAFAALLVPASPASAAEAKPAWRLRMVALPTNLAPDSDGSTKFGPVYELIATNIGGAAAVGPVTLSATFPTGVTPIFDADAPLGEDRDNSSPDPVCANGPGFPFIRNSPNRPGDTGVHRKIERDLSAADRRPTGRARPSTSREGRGRLNRQATR